MRGVKLTEGLGYSPEKMKPEDIPPVNPNFFNAQSHIVIQKAEEYDMRKQRYNFNAKISNEPVLLVKVYPYGKVEDKYDLIPFIPDHFKGD